MGVKVAAALGLLVLLSVLIAPGSVRSAPVIVESTATWDWKTPPATPSTLQAPNYFPNVGTPTHPACPGGSPEGWGSVTPSGMWAQLCADCLPAEATSTEYTWGAWPTSGTGTAVTASATSGACVDGAATLTPGAPTATVTPGYSMTQYDDNAAGWSYVGTWGTATDGQATYGHFHYIDAVGGTASYTFTGTGFDMVSPMGPGWGGFDVTVDGVSVGGYSIAHAGSVIYDQTVFSHTGMALGSHTVVFTSTAVASVVDSIFIYGGQLPTPTAAVPQITLSNLSYSAWQGTCGGSGSSSGSGLPSMPYTLHGGEILEFYANINFDVGGPPCDYINGFTIDAQNGTLYYKYESEVVSGCDDAAYYVSALYPDGSGSMLAGSGGETLRLFCHGSSSTHNEAVVHGWLSAVPFTVISCPTPGVEGDLCSAVHSEEDMAALIGDGSGFLSIFTPLDRQCIMTPYLSVGPLLADYVSWWLNLAPTAVKDAVGGFIAALSGAGIPATTICFDRYDIQPVTLLGISLNWTILVDALIVVFVLRHLMTR